MKLNFDRLAQQITQILGSAPVILLFLIWLVYHNATDWDYTNFISDVAIEIGLLILRAENVQSAEMERDIKRTKRVSKKDLAKSDEVLEILEKKR